MRPYAWGSRTVIAELRGEPSPSPHPEAELWLGAHPGDPSHLVGPTAGARRCSRRSARRPRGPARPGPVRGAGPAALPFLLKVLAADQPLSLQAHPSLAQAAEGFARRRPPGIPRRRARPQLPRRQPQAGADLRAHPVRTRSWASGRPADTSTLLRALDVPATRRRTSSCWPRSRTPPGCGRCSPPGSRCRSRVLDERCPRSPRARVRLARRGPVRPRGARSVLELAERYPGDAGVLAALLLNRVTLRPARRSTCPRATCTCTCPARASS